MGKEEIRVILLGFIVVLLFLLVAILTSQPSLTREQRYDNCISRYDLKKIGMFKSVAVMQDCLEEATK